MPGPVAGWGLHSSSERECYPGRQDSGISKCERNGAAVKRSGRSHVKKFLVLDDKPHALL